jgi:hypothetical protein
MIEDNDWDSDSETPSGLYWHYTNASGLLGILQSNALWASSASMLNDSRELAFGEDLIHSVWEKRREEIISYGASQAKENFQPVFKPNAESWIAAVLQRGRETMSVNASFVFCASQDGDSLSQWRAYAGQTGYAIGLDRSVSLKVKVPADYDQHREANDIGHLIPDWKPVHYDEGEQQLRAFQLFLGLYVICPSSGYSWEDYDWKRIVLPAIFSYANAVAEIKHPGFVDEREVRVSVGEPNLERYVKFRAGQYGITPYVELVTEEPDPVVRSGVRAYVTKSRGQERLPIVAVRIGPGPSATTAREGLRTALRHYGYEHAKVLPSAVPYR